MPWTEILAFYAVGAIVALLVQSILIHDLIAEFDRVILRAACWPIVISWNVFKWAIILFGVAVVYALFRGKLPKRPKEAPRS